MSETRVAEAHPRLFVCGGRESILYRPPKSNCGRLAAAKPSPFLGGLLCCWRLCVASSSGVALRRPLNWVGWVVQPQLSHCSAPSVGFPHFGHWSIGTSCGWIVQTGVRTSIVEYMVCIQRVQVYISTEVIFEKVLIFVLK